MVGAWLWARRGAATAVLAALTVPMFAGAGHAQTEPDPIQRVSDPIADEYVVVLKANRDGNVPGLANALTRQYDGELLFTYEHALAGFAVRMNDQRARGLAHNPFVEIVAQNGVASLVAEQPNPPSWGLDRVDERDLPLDAKFVYGSTGTGVTAYIIDTGILYSHGDFGGRASLGYDAVGGGQNGSDCNGHGTHVAGTVGGSSYGIAKQVTLRSVRVLGCNGSGTWAGVIAGVDWVTSDHDPGEMAVANMSLGGGAYSALDTAVANSIADGVTYAVAAGNSSANACNYSPARAPNAITVGSTTSSDARSSFSNYGSCVDLFAPGSSITSAWHTSDAASNTISGTSMASPHVAGAAALYLSANGNTPPADVAGAFTGNATVGKVTDAGAGSPNLLLFVGTGDGSSPPPPPPLAPPGAPQSLGAAGQRKAVQLTWQTPASGGAPTGYRVYRGSSPTTITQLVASLPVQTSWRNNGLKAVTTYCYQVVAINSAGTGPPSNAACANTR